MNTPGVAHQLWRRLTLATPRRTFSAQDQDRLIAWSPLPNWEPWSLNRAVEFGAWDHDVRSMVIPLDKQAPLGVATIRPVILQGSFCRIFDRRGSFYTSSSWYGPAFESLQLKLEWLKLGYPFIEGRTLVLGSEWSGNYYHWMVDCLGKYILFLLSGGSLETIQTILLPRPPNPAVGLFLQVLGIDQTKIVWVDSNRGFRLEEAVIPSYPGHRGMTHPIILRALAASLRPAVFQQSGPDFHPRLIITREGWLRRLTNRGDLLALLEPLNFHLYPIESRTDTQHHDFHRADFIVAQHGAALTNLLFSEAGTKVVEIMSPDHPHAAFVNLCQALGIENRLVWGTAATQRKLQWNTTGRRSELDIRVDPDLVRQALDSLA